MNNYYDKFKNRPEIMDCCTMIVCSHPYHGVETFYLNADDFQRSIAGLLAPYWVNSYTINIIPCE